MYKAFKHSGENGKIIKSKIKQDHKSSMKHKISSLPQQQQQKHTRKEIHNIDHI